MNATDKYMIHNKMVLETQFDKTDSSKTYAFYGVCGNQFKLDDVVFEAIEDPSDGYRSYLETIKVVDSDGIFQKAPLARVYIRKIDDTEPGDSYNGYQLVDYHTGHVWLSVGTDNTDDYYPYFTFEYQLPEVN